MANDSSNTGVPKEFIAWLGRVLMALVAGKDLRVREAIALAVVRAGSREYLEHETRWHAPAANRPGE